MKQLFILFAFGLGCLNGSAQQVKAARDFDSNTTSSGGDPYANSNAIKSQYNDCQTRSNNLRHVIDSLNNNYTIDSKQYQQGLFCSDCHRSKRQIEAAGLNFYEHIQEGAAGGRHIVPATAQQMADLRNDYMNQYNNAKNDFENNQASCNALNSQYNSAYNQDYQALQNEKMKEQQAKIDAENEKRKEAQDKLRQEQEERQREAQAKIDQFLQQQKEQQQKEQQAQNELDAKTKQLGDETQSKLENARQQNQLQEYTDPTDQAKSILNSPGSGETSVFAAAFTEPSTLNSDDEIKAELAAVDNEYNNSGAAENNYGKQSLTNKFLDLINLSPSPDAGDMPEGGYNESGNKITQGISAVRNFFSSSSGDANAAGATNNTPPRSVSDAALQSIVMFTGGKALVDAEVLPVITPILTELSPVVFEAGTALAIGSGVAEVLAGGYIVYKVVDKGSAIIANKVITPIANKVHDIAGKLPDISMSQFINWETDPEQ